MKLAQPTHPHSCATIAGRPFLLWEAMVILPLRCAANRCRNMAETAKKDGIPVAGRCDYSHHRSQGREGGAVPVGFDHCVQCITPPVGPIVSRTQPNFYCHSTPCHWRHTMSALLSPKEKKKTRVKLAR